MSTRTIAQQLDASVEFVGPHKVLRPLPHRQLKQVDPFIFIDHMEKRQLAPGEEMRIPPHPHAGFEVVTYLLEGEFFHRDSAGHDQIARAGDLNWMTSGKGIVHSEGPTADFIREGGGMELMQVWINLPASKKGMEPDFHHYASADLPVVKDGAAAVKVLVGELKGKKSPVITQTPMYYYDVTLEAGDVWLMPVPENFTAGIYLMSGGLQVTGQPVSKRQLVTFEANGNQVALRATEKARFIAFGGEPIGEKVVSYGPFVMNSFDEIQEKIMDFERGKMGMLES
ncbi:pirin family protein [Flavihumibacter petaseus]|uniref:Pirin family protein n=1 Tax=Flavihumibacter petaseus NBRC 106054 TaxID=1220578 RepID=A0A0E9MWB5_9BACT|nr:pirin family protein [Flavihumibacter petaseus]GAO41731.1 hypothetical protein FPE01S_01_07450 [Flavihumibacter petaseus NBRC 106054]